MPADVFQQLRCWLCKIRVLQEEGSTYMNHRHWKMTKKQYIAKANSEKTSVQHESISYISVQLISCLEVYSMAIRKLYLWWLCVIRCIWISSAFWLVICGQFRRRNIPTPTKAPSRNIWLWFGNHFVCSVEYERHHTKYDEDVYDNLTGSVLTV